VVSKFRGRLAASETCGVCAAIIRIFSSWRRRELDKKLKTNPGCLFLDLSGVLLPSLEGRGSRLFEPRRARATQQADKCYYNQRAITRKKYLVK
jgi:hypothetical protein